MTLRKAGASVRELLVSASELIADSHFIHHKKSGKKVAYGDLVKTAQDIKLPENPTLKKKSQFKYIGTELDNLDNHLFVTGQAEYGIDKTLPNMLYASIQRSPVFGGKIISVDKQKTMAFHGVKNVIEIKGTPGPALFNPLEGVAVIATNTWAAEQGKLLLDIKWNEGENNSFNSDQYKDSFEVKEKSNEVDLSRSISLDNLNLNIYLIILFL